MLFSLSFFCSCSPLLFSVSHFSQNYFKYVSCAASTIKLGSTLIFASCVINRPPVLQHVLFEHIRAGLLLFNPHIIHRIYTYLSRNFLPKVRLLNLCDGNPRNRRRHPSPALESRRPPLRRVPPGVGAADGVDQVTADLVGRLQSEQIEAPANTNRNRKEKIGSTPSQRCYVAVPISALLHARIHPSLRCYPRIAWHFIKLCLKYVSREFDNFSGVDTHLCKLRGTPIVRFCTHVLSFERTRLLL